MYHTQPPDPTVLADYEALSVGGTPQSLMDAALVARNEEDIGVLAKAFTGDREGYANNHRMPTAERMAKAAADFSFAGDDIGEAEGYGTMVE